MSELLGAIDVSFDFRQDTPPGMDPDARSPTLRRYHRRLWSKALPSGEVLDLRIDTPKVYLHHRSDLGEFVLSSDTVVPSFRKERRLSTVLEQLSQESRDAFAHLTYTIGGMMVFPGNQVAGKMTINGARGCHPKIKDRFDLTVECIRRHYRGEESPLSGPLARYTDFFRLFESFHSYVQFFLLDDLVTSDCSAVRFFLPFDGFAGSPLPLDAPAYAKYCQRAADFIRARNSRISALSLQSLAL
jgi:hypothetical protein